MCVSKQLPQFCGDNFHRQEYTPLYLNHFTLNLCGEGGGGGWGRGGGALLLKEKYLLPKVLIQYIDRAK